MGKGRDHRRACSCVHLTGRLSAFLRPSCHVPRNQIIRRPTTSLFLRARQDVRQETPPPASHLQPLLYQVVGIGLNYLQDPQETPREGESCQEVEAGGPNPAGVQRSLQAPRGWRWVRHTPTVRPSRTAQPSSSTHRCSPVPPTPTPCTASPPPHLQGLHSQLPALLTLTPAGRDPWASCTFPLTPCPTTCTAPHARAPTATATPAPGVPPPAPGPPPPAPAPTPGTAPPAPQNPPAGAPTAHAALHATAPKHRAQTSSVCFVTTLRLRAGTPDAPRPCTFCIPLPQPCPSATGSHHCPPNALSPPPLAAI